MTPEDKAAEERKAQIILEDKALRPIVLAALRYINTWYEDGEGPDIIEDARDCLIDAIEEYSHPDWRQAGR